MFSTSDTGGARPRPRVALLGEFGEETLNSFARLFPTIWQGKDVSELTNQIHPNEVDLLIIAQGIAGAGNWPDQVQVICFSTDFEHLPAIYPGILVQTIRSTETEQYVFPKKDLGIDRLRKSDFSELKSVRGWPLLNLAWHPHKTVRKGTSQQDFENAKKELKESAIIADYHNRLPFSVIFQRPGTNLGVAWLPQSEFDQVAWVEEVLRLWAQKDTDAFPISTDWTKSKRWMVAEEEELVSQINEFELKRIEVIADIDNKIGELKKELTKASTVANKGLRRLISSKGDELVIEVSNVLSQIGFQVENVDETLMPGLPKREDLRLTDLNVPVEEWEAIVEVRGYDRSTGRSADLLRLSRFANLYNEEKGRMPEKQIYVVNPQVSLPPNQREILLASASEDIQVFSEDQGVIISTLDLFETFKNVEKHEHSKIMESIKSSTGRWEFKQTHPDNE